MKARDAKQGRGVQSCTVCHTTLQPPKQTLQQGWHFRVSELRCLQHPQTSKLSEELAAGPFFRVSPLPPPETWQAISDVPLPSSSQYSPAQVIASLCQHLAEDSHGRKSIQAELKGQCETDRQMIPQKVWYPEVGRIFQNQPDPFVASPATATHRQRRGVSSRTGVPRAVPWQLCRLCHSFSLWQSQARQMYAVSTAPREPPKPKTCLTVSGEHV